jgi:hypothetical protein
VLPPFRDTSPSPAQSALPNQHFPISIAQSAFPNQHFPISISQSALPNQHFPISIAQSALPNPVFAFSPFRIFAIRPRFSSLSTPPAFKKY